MYSWIVRRIVGFLYGKISRGELRLALLLLAEDARFSFPGQSSFGVELRGKRQIAGWMARFASLRPQFTVCDAAAAGPPWNLRILMRFEDRIVAPNGYVYENSGMEHLVVRNGLIREINVYLDTQKVALLDAQLGSPGSEPGGSSSVIV
jgi:ketosteroid isomerase-like protein